MANQPTKYKKFVATAATATLVASAIVPAVSAAEVNFTDIGGYAQDTQDKIVSLAERGIINGTSETTFTPAKDITRGQVVKILGRYLVEELGAEIPEDWATEKRFTDVDLAKDEELSKYAAVVFDAGVFEGNNGALEASKLISRQNMAVVLDRAAEAITGISLVDAAAALELEGDVKDIEKAKESAREAILALNALEISTVENFKPTNNVSRANFATFLYNAIEVIAELADSATDLEKALAALPKADEVTAENAEESQELVDVAQAALDAAIEAEEVTEEEAKEAQALIDAVQAAIDALEAGDAAIASVTAVNKTTVTVVLNKEVDAVKAENFTIEGASVTAATLGEDKKTVTLTVSGLAYETEYTVAAKDIEVDGEATDFGTSKFKTLAVDALWTLAIESSESSLLADGADNAVLTFKLLNAKGEVDKDADNVVLDLNTTYGTLASKRVTIQDGVATVLLTSEFSNANVTAKIDAQIIEASGDYKELIGEVFATSYVPFVTTSTENVETITLVSAEANQADRLTLFFDKAVSVKHFVKTNVDGELLYNVDSYTNSANVVVPAQTAVSASAIPAGTPAEYITHAFKSNANTIIVKQGTKSYSVKGVKPVAGNARAIEVILDKTQDNQGNYTNALIDNASVDVEVNAENSLGKATNSKASFKVTDARNPEATSVQVEGLNTLKVKFSEAIADSTFRIDGRFVEPTHFNATFGDFNPVTYEDTRDLATIELTSQYDEDGISDNQPTNKTLAGYFSAGTHTIQVSATKDFAHATDTNNIGQTQNLNFTVAEDKAQPTATVVVESPEQIRVKFDKTIGLSAAQFKALLGAQSNGANSGIELQVLNPLTGSYSAVATTNTGSGVEFNYSNDFTVEKYGNEYVVELTKDWTTKYKTETSNKNYYNDKYRLVIAKGAVTNAANGLKNEVINLDLNYSGSLLNSPDVTSPTIDSIERVSTTSNKFDVTMSEPVKLVVQDPSNSNANILLDNAGDTLAETQGALGRTTAQFIGKDKNGQTVTIEGQVVKYSDKNGADKVIEVQWKTGQGVVTPQSIVDDGGDTNWTLVVRSISDDVGNTVASATKNFTIGKSPSTATPFYVEAETAANKGTHQAYANDLRTDLTKDTVVITFTEGVKVTGANAATNPSHYTLNGKTLPAGTNIKVQNTNGTVTADTNGFEQLVITLPEGTLNYGANASNIITINKALESYDGTIITKDTEIVLYSAENAALAALAANVAAVAAANTAINAVNLATQSTIADAQNKVNAITNATDKATAQAALNTKVGATPTTAAADATAAATAMGYIAASNGKLSPATITQTGTTLNVSGLTAVTGFTEFSSVAAQQEGKFAVIKFEAPSSVTGKTSTDNVKVTVTGGSSNVGTYDGNGFFYLVLRFDAAGGTKEVAVDWNNDASVVTTYSITAQ